MQGISRMQLAAKAWNKCYNFFREFQSIVLTESEKKLKPKSWTSKKWGYSWFPIDRDWINFLGTSNFLYRAVSRVDISWFDETLENNSVNLKKRITINSHRGTGTLAGSEQTLWTKSWTSQQRWVWFHSFGAWSISRKSCSSKTSKLVVVICF